MEVINKLICDKKLRILETDGYRGVLVCDLSRYLGVKQASVTHHIHKQNLEFTELSSSTFEILRKKGLMNEKCWKNAIVPISTVARIVKACRSPQALRVNEELWVGFLG